MEETKHVHVNEDPDSIEIGTPGKGGAVKVFGDFNNVDTFKKKIDAAKEIRAYAQAQLKLEV